MKALCLLSGGMDSSTLAYYAKKEGFSIYALHLNYGQRTESKERACAQKVADLLGVLEFIEINLEYFSRIGGSALTDNQIDIDDFDPDLSHLPNTYVPFRNANLLSIATSFAESRGASAIFIGAQALDYSGYPDCRPEFIEAFQRVIDLGTRDGTDIELHAPFVNMTKTDILKLGMRLDVPYEHTWSCYQNLEKACGRCGACHYRLEAFAADGIHDPLKYME